MTRNLVFSNYLSARALRQGLELLGENLLAVDSPGFLVPPADRPPAPGDRLFFTDEWTLGRFIGRSEFYFHPQALAVTLDDKLMFARQVREAGGKPVPFWAIGERLPDSEFPVVLKGRHSWREGRAMPRGGICRTPEALAQTLQDFETAGISADHFFVQRFLPDGVSNAWSVCGFFDTQHPDHNELLVIHKRVATRDGLGYVLAAAVEPDPASLEARAMDLLGQLDYTGPFELEFLQDTGSGEFYELELNPRFWLQHSIFIHARDNRLLRRYLGLPIAEPSPDPASVLWVNGVGLILSLLSPWRPSSRALLRVMTSGAAGRRMVVDPSLPVALRIALRQILARLMPWRRAG